MRASLKSEEISKLIKDQIRRYDEDLETDETGTIATAGDGIALIYGLQSAMVGELPCFSGDIHGMVLNLEEEHVGATLTGDDSNIRKGDKVKRIGRIIEALVRDGMLGRVVNVLEQAIDGGEPIKSDKFRPVECVVPGVMTRKSVHQPIQTGLKITDSMIPIGRDRRELIIGGRQTGKTVVAIDTIINQKNNDVKRIYVAIGQKASTVAQIVEKLRSHGTMEYTTTVSSTASEPAPLQYIAPYVGCATGEEWMENGDDVLIVYDDLSKYAAAYRTTFPLLKRPPRREVHPGDISYLHPRLLERAARLNDELGVGSPITLPIIETQIEDIPTYISINVISITNGQIFLQTELFNSGVRPAVDNGPSVSRVGSAAQIKVMKQMSGSLKLELVQFREVQAFAKPKSNLGTATAKVLAYGERLTRLLIQNQYDSLPVTHQVLALLAAKNKFLKPVKVEDVQLYEKEMLKYMERNHTDILTEIEEKQALDDALSANIKAALQAFEAESENMIGG